MFLCAEDDDLALAGVVHLGREAGLDIEVVTALEWDDGPFIDAIEACDRGLFAIVRSKNLPADRALQLKSTFALARIDGLEIVTLLLSRSPEETLKPLFKKLERLDGWARPAAAPEPEPAKPDASTGPYPRVESPGHPLAAVPQLEAPEHQVTLSGAVGETTIPTPRVDVPPVEDVDVRQLKPRPWRWFAAAVGVCMAGGVGYALTQSDPTPAAQAPAPTVQVVKAAAVPPDEDDATPDLRSGSAAPPEARAQP
ncbi:MAG: hypothetical protein AAGA54_14525 [Myxococcota bacterium]